MLLFMNNKMLHLIKKSCFFKLHKTGVEIKQKNTISFKCKISSLGKGNQILIDKDSLLRNCTFYINGNNNIVSIGKNCVLNGVVFWIEGSNNNITIGNDVYCSGQQQLSCIEGTELLIDDQCIISSNVKIGTGDGHSVVDLEGKRLNKSMSVKIGEHVWICNGARVLKGVSIEKDSIVASDSVVTKSFSKANVIIAGNPGRVVKENINWERNRI